MVECAGEQATEGWAGCMGRTGRERRHGSGVMAQVDSAWLSRCGGQVVRRDGGSWAVGGDAGRW